MRWSTGYPKMWKDYTQKSGSGNGRNVGNRKKKGGRKEERERKNREDVEGEI